MSHFTMGGAALLQDEATLPSFGASTTSKQERELMSRHKAMLDSMEPEPNALQQEQKPAMADAKRKHNADMDAPIPKKARTTETITARPKDTPASHESKSIPNRDIGNLVPNRCHGNPTATGKEFSVVFDSRTALGFYCVTNQDKQQASYCKIISVCPHGSKNKNSLVQPGVVAVAAQVHGQAKVTVTGCADLMDCYETAQERGLSITITFTNGFVASEAAQGTHQFALQWWTLDGQWVGKCKRGWDGGASTVWEPCSILKVTNTLLTPAAVKSGLAKKAVQFDATLCFREPGKISGEGEADVDFSGNISPIYLRARYGTTQELGSLQTYLGNSFYSGTTKFRPLANKLNVHRNLVATAVKSADATTTLQELQLIDAILAFRLEGSFLLHELNELRFRRCMELRIMSVHGADTIASTVHPGSQLAMEVLQVCDHVGADPGVMASIPSMPLSSCDGVQGVVKRCVIDYNSKNVKGKDIVFCVSADSRQEVSVTCDSLVKLTRKGPGHHNFTMKSNGVAIQLSVRQVPSKLSEKQEDVLRRVTSLATMMDAVNLDLKTWNKENGGNVKPFTVDQALFQRQSLLHAVVLGVDPVSLKFLLQGQHQLGHKVLSSCLSLAKDLQREKPTILKNRKKQAQCLEDMVRWLSHAASRVESGHKVDKTNLRNLEAVGRAAQVTDSPESKKPVLDINDLH